MAVEAAGGGRLLPPYALVVARDRSGGDVGEDVREVEEAVPSATASLEERG